MHPGDAEHGVVDAVALETAVAEDLPGLHAGEDVLDAGPDLLVGLVVVLFPVRQYGLAAPPPVRDDESGARVAAVGDRDGAAYCGLGAGFLPCLAVVAVPGQRPANHDDQAGVGVDDDLVVGGVPVVLRPLRDCVVPGGDQGAVHDQHGVLREPLAGLESEPRPEGVDDPVRRRLGHPEQRCELPHGQVRAPVGRDQQCPVLQRKTPRPAPADRVRLLAPQHSHQLSELPRAQSGERGYPRRLRRRDHTSHTKIIPGWLGFFFKATDRRRIMEKDEALQLAVAFLADSQRDDEPPLAIDAERVRVSNGLLIVPYNSVPYLASREPREQLLDCWPVLVDLARGEVRFGTLDERHLWRNPSA